MGDKFVRGGDWFYDSSSLSSSGRSVSYPAFENSFLGFRVVKEVGPSNREFRGGGWGDSAGRCRSAYRNWGSPSYRSFGVGFRVVKEMTNGQ